MRRSAAGQLDPPTREALRKFQKQEGLPPTGMRRLRMLDIRLGDRIELWAMLRDSHLDDDNVETSVHEYELKAAVAADTMTIEEIEATPHVLPWIECPMAAASAPRLVGQSLSDVASLVRGEFTGVSTCTHLNTLMAGMADAEQLVTLLHSAP